MTQSNKELWHTLPDWEFSGRFGRPIFKLAVGFLFSMLALLPHAIQSQNFPNIQLLTVQYGNGSIPTALRPQAAQWLVSHFDYNLGGHFDLTPYPGTNWVGYQDGAGAYAGGLYAWVHDVAAQNGFKYEDMLLHINRDYAVAAGYAWTNLDQFDYFEQNYWQQSGGGSSTNAVRGAFILAGGAYTDVTVALYDNKHKTTVSNQLYLGYAEPFDLVNLNVSSGRGGGSANWQYWNGSTWANLAVRSDTTGGIATTGAIRFDPPANWTPTVVNGSRSKYWVRLTVSGAATAPVLSKVFGDDWLSHYGTNNCRGWNKSDPNRINVGLGNLEYNPTPPVNARARFRYQARSTGFWAHNYLFMNPTNQQKGQYSWISTLLSAWASALNSPGAMKYKGIYFDNAGTAPATTPAFTPAMSDDLPPGTTWQTANVAFYGALKTAVKAAYGSSYPVGANSGFLGISMELDFVTRELWAASWVNGDASPNGFNGMDSFLPSANPGGVKSSFSAWDNQHFGYTGSGVFHLWDTANRTPMSVLATYYMGSNPNTMLLYNTVGWTYYDTDEYYHWSPSTTTLSAPLNADSSTNRKTISVTDGSSITVPGGPLWKNTTNAATAAAAANVFGYAIKIGNDVVKPFKDSNTSFHTFTPILNSYPAGTVVEFAVMGHQSTDPIPDWHSVWYWANYFPAMSVDLGPPDSNGWKSGARDFTFVGAVAASGNPSGCVPATKCSEVWRRDFTKAIVLVKVLHSYTAPFEFDTYSPYIQLGGTYYELYADGTTGPGVTQVRLRGGEAAILMKSPNPSRR